MTDNLPGFGSFVSRESPRRRNSVSTLPLPNSGLTDRRVDVDDIFGPMIIPPPAAAINRDIERGKALSWDENLERGRERTTMGL